MRHGHAVAQYLPFFMLMVLFCASRSAPSLMPGISRSGSQFLGNDYIYVSQDTRGRFKSEGDYVMFRHPLEPLNDADTDHTTDTWDTFEWLINNVDSNGRVGVWGTSTRNSSFTH